MLFCSSGCPLEVTQLCSYVLSEHRCCSSSWQRYQRHTQCGQYVAATTNAEMPPGDNGMQNRPALPAGVPRIYAQLLEERLLGRLWRPRPLPFVATRRIGRQRSTCKRESTAARLPRRTAVAGFRRSKFIINIRVLQAFASQSADSSSIAICTPCLLPWYLPQSRSRSDWRRVGPSMGDDR